MCRCVCCSNVHDVQRQMPAPVLHLHLLLPLRIPVSGGTPVARMVVWVEAPANHSCSVLLCLQAGIYCGTICEHLSCSVPWMEARRSAIFLNGFPRHESLRTRPKYTTCAATHTSSVTPWPHPRTRHSHWIPVSLRISVNFTTVRCDTRRDHRRVFFVFFFP
jgi:hypothetical protein